MRGITTYWLWIRCLLLYSALSNFGQGYGVLYSVTAGSTLNDTCLSLMEGSNNLWHCIVGHSPPSPALHDNGTRQLSKYIAGTRLLSFPLAPIFTGLGERHADTSMP